MEKVNLELEEAYNKQALGLANYMIRINQNAIRYFGDYEDMRQSLLLIMWKALPYWHNDLSTFSAYMSVVCKHEICKQIKRCKAKKRAGLTVSMQEEVFEGLTLEDILGEEIDICEDIDRANMIESITPMLNKEAHAYFIDGISIDNISRALGKSTHWIRERIKKNINRIRLVINTGSLMIKDSTCLSSYVIEQFGFGPK